MNRLTDKEVLALLRSDTAVNRARKVLSGYLGHFEQQALQAHSTSPIDVRREEFEAIAKIIEAAGIPEVLAAAKRVVDAWEAGMLASTGFGHQQIAATQSIGALITALRSVTL